jgi:hypothetical protein
VHRSEDEAPSFAFGLGSGVGDPVDLQAIGIQQADQPTAVAQGGRCPEQDPEAVPGRQLTGVQDEPALVTVKDGPAGQVDRLGGDVEEGEGLGLGRRADGGEPLPGGHVGSATTSTWS